MRIGILTVSDRSSQGLREDASGRVLIDWAKKTGAQVGDYRIVPDEKNEIAAALISLVDDLRCEVVLTTGGTGIGPRDVTPEATQEVIDREIPGVSEAIRWEGFKETPHALLSRGISGIRGKSLIVNLPGSPEAVRQALEILDSILVHAVDLLQGRVSDCGKVREEKWKSD